MTPSLPFRVLVVDDSAFARKVVREILAAAVAVEVVGTARDGQEALDLVERLAPDLVICDLRMPRMDGVAFIRAQMARRPLPILILSSASQDAEEVVEALDAGAVDVVQKPNALATDDLRKVRDDLVAKVREAMHVPPQALVRVFAPTPVAAQRAPVGRTTIIVIGISTGGPQALRRMMPLFPADFPVPIAVVLHMPLGYTALYAEKLNELCPLEVKEAAEGDVVRAGRVLLAPAGRHLRFHRQPDGTVTARLTLEPLESIHRPAANVLFQSAAEVFGEGVLAVVMTGMGDDGTIGAACVKAQGGTVITEAEKSCVIYGMPRSVAEAGLSDAPIPLDDMAAAIATRL